MPLFRRRTNEMPPEAFDDPIGFRIRHGIENLLEADVRFGIYLISPMFVGLIIAIVVGIPKLLPLLWTLGLVGAAVVVGYFGLFVRYTTLKFEAGRHIVYVFLVYEARGRRWANYFVPSDNPFEVDIPEGNAYLDAKLRGKDTGTTNEPEFKDVKVKVKQRYHIYLMRWLVPAHVIPWCILLAPAHLIGEVVNEKGERVGGTFSPVEAQILYKSFFVTVPAAANGVLALKWQFQYKEQMIPVYEIIASDYHAEAAQRGIFIPSLGPETGPEAVNLTMLRENIVKDQRIASLEAEVQALLKGKEDFQSAVTRATTAEREDWYRSRKIPPRERKEATRYRYLTPIIVIAGFALLIVALAYATGILH